jgi:hypothetical protein
VHGAGAGEGRRRRERMIQVLPEFRVERKNESQSAVAGVRERAARECEVTNCAPSATLLRLASL